MGRAARASGSGAAVRPVAALRSAVAAVAAVALAASLGGCTALGSPRATFSFDNGRGLAIGDSGAISVYTDLDGVPGWTKDPGSDVDFSLYREAATGCVVGLERLDVLGEKYLVAGDDASSTRGLIDATAGLNENRGLRGPTLIALNDTAAKGNRQTVDALRIVYAPDDAGRIHHDAALVRVFTGAGVALVAQASCDTDAQLRAAMPVLRQHVAFVVEH
ncbi:MAG TPA: hypothetical protein VIG28_01610 [Leifsonia sp.]